MQTVQINGTQIALTDGNSSLLLGVDAGNNLVTLKADGPPQQELQVRLEIDHQDMKISLLNHSDLGLTVDNNGVTTIFSADLKNAVLNSENGSKFRLVVANDGSISTAPV